MLSRPSSRKQLMTTTLNLSETVSIQELWQVVYRSLERTLATNMVHVWVQPLEAKSLQQNGDQAHVVLEASNEFAAQWIRDKYLQKIEETFEQTLGKRTTVEIAISDKPKASAPSERTGSSPVVAAESDLPPTTSAGIVLQTGSRAATTPPLSSSVDSRYNFENFVVGASNQFAYASCVAVAEKPGGHYNPLFLYGSPGLGKTHLLNAIGSFVLRNNPNCRVCSISAEQFVNELIESIQHKKMSQFRSKYRESYDVILIDDIQFIAGKQTSEEEFFHTFNALYHSGRQIVVTSDRSPKEINDLEERVRTRFEWGLIADIQPPEIETRIAILRTKAERDDIYLPDDVATFLASSIRTNVRELEGVLTSLKAQASLTGLEISLEMTKQLLKMNLAEDSSQISVESIQNAVIKFFNLKMNDLKSTSRAQSVALPRQIAMYLIRKYTSLGYKEIGRYFGGKDHTTIMHACNKIEKSLDDSSEIAKAVEGVQNLL